MKAIIISQNTKRQTAQIVIHYGPAEERHSETRHCKLSPDLKWRGYVLDAHRGELSRMADNALALAGETDRLNRELQIKAVKATAYEPRLLFAWRAGADNEAEYMTHISQERQTANQRIDHLLNEVAVLRSQAEIKRAVEQARRKVAPVSGLVALRDVFVGLAVANGAS